MSSKGKLGFPHVSAEHLGENMKLVTWLHLLGIWGQVGGKSTFCSINEMWHISVYDGSFVQTSKMWHISIYFLFKNLATDDIVGIESYTKHLRLPPASPSARHLSLCLLPLTLMTREAGTDSRLTLKQSPSPPKHIDVSPLDLCD